MPDDLLAPFHRYIDRMQHLARPDARVTVTSTPLPEDKATGYRIVGLTAGDVQREIDRILWDIEATGGEAHFRNPSIENGRWVSHGFTRVLEPVGAA